MDAGWVTARARHTVFHRNVHASAFSHDPKTSSPRRVARLSVPHVLILTTPPSSPTLWFGTAWCLVSSLNNSRVYGHANLNTHDPV